MSKFNNKNIDEMIQASIYSLVHMKQWFDENSAEENTEYVLLRLDEIAKTLRSLVDIETKKPDCDAVLKCFLEEPDPCRDGDRYLVKVKGFDISVLHLPNEIGKQRLPKEALRLLEIVENGLNKYILS